MMMECSWNNSDRTKLSTQRRTCSNATLSTTHSAWTHLGFNPGLGGDRPATSRLSHIVACVLTMGILCSFTEPPASVWANSDHRHAAQDLVNSQGNHVGCSR